MELLQISYFLTVAQTQHMTRAAQHLHISQPALTKTIHRLEQELGVPLFLPNGRGIVLSEYGKHLQEKLTPIYDQIVGLPSELQKMARLENQTVHLNVLAASALVTEAVIAYNKQYPPLRFEITQNRESTLFDVGVTTRLFYQLSDEAQLNDCVLTEKIYMAVPISHPLSERETVRLEEFQDAEFISLMGSREFRSICDRFCRHAGFSPKIIFESDSPATVQNMIAAEMGVGFWPAATWGKLKTDAVRLLSIEAPVCQRDLLFQYRRNKTDDSATQTFFSFLVDYFKSLLHEADIASNIGPSAEHQKTGAES